MSQISSVYFRRNADQSALGVRADELLRGVGIDPHAPPDLHQLLPSETYYEFLEQLADACDGPPTFHIKTGATMQCEDLGALGLSWKAAPCLFQSFERAARFSKILVGTASYAIVDRGDTMLMTHTRTTEDRRGMRLSKEATLATLLSMARETAAADLVPLAVQYSHPAMDTAPAVEAYFKCPVTFRADVDALVFDRETMMRPNPMADDGVYRFFESYLEEELGRRDQEDALDARIKLQVSERLSDGVPTISEIAGGLGLSGRTLQRRLSESGLSFQSLVDDSRRQLAERLLLRTEYSLAEVAFLTGFSEQSAFTRAFKRWAGRTPRTFRTEARPLWRIGSKLWRGASRRRRPLSTIPLPAAIGGD